MPDGHHEQMVLLGRPADGSLEEEAMGQRDRQDGRTKRRCAPGQGLDRVNELLTRETNGCCSRKEVPDDV
jgi:hypothetical protein